MSNALTRGGGLVMKLSKVCVLILLYFLGENHECRDRGAQGAELGHIQAGVHKVPYSPLKDGIPFPQIFHVTPRPLCNRFTYRGFHEKGSFSNLCALGIDR